MSTVVLRFLKLVFALLALASIQSCSPQTPPQAPPQNLDILGTTYDIHFLLKTKSNSKTSNSSSSSRMSLREKVVKLEPHGMVLEFDLLPKISSEERSKQWHFPARVLKRHDGSLELLNTPALEKRLKVWLEKAKLDTSSCDTWIFTWNAFEIDCDPHSVIDKIKPFDLRLIDLVDGAMYTQTGANQPSPLISSPIESGGTRYKTKMEIDPNYFRRQRAEQNIIVAKLMGDNAPTLEEAIQKMSLVQYSGTVETEIKTDKNGRVIYKRAITQYETTSERGRVKQHTITETVNRTLLLETDMPISTD